ncbi:SMR family transporter [Candidatus Coxiella mudrowiae]|uniref:SMR family transporter n=1 Tax=Candidatus Coxiella mudrowiae TaxID=2054173 RepID=UPI0027D2E3E5|nr:SMR family transporter [Candidatus Coxiella mudrowiae]
MPFLIRKLFFIIIISKLISTSALKVSEGFAKFGPSIIVIIGYEIVFYLVFISLI